MWTPTSISIANSSPKPATCSTTYRPPSSRQWRARRLYILNAAVLTLTSLSLVAVVIAGYDFVRAQQEMIRTRVERIDVLFFLVALIAVLTGVLMVRSRPGDG